MRSVHSGIKMNGYATKEGMYYCFRLRAVNAPLFSSLSLCCDSVIQGTVGGNNNGYLTPSLAVP